MSPTELSRYLVPIRQIKVGPSPLVQQEERELAVCLSLKSKWLSKKFVEGYRRNKSLLLE